MNSPRGFSFCPGLAAVDALEEISSSMSILSDWNNDAARKKSFDFFIPTTRKQREWRNGLITPSFCVAYLFIHHVKQEKKIPICRL